MICKCIIGAFEAHWGFGLDPFLFWFGSLPNSDLLSLWFRSGTGLSFGYDAGIRNPQINGFFFAVQKKKKEKEERGSSKDEGGGKRWV